MHQLRNRLEWLYSKDRRASALELAVVNSDLGILDCSLFYEAAAVLITSEAAVNKHKET